MARLRTQALLRKLGIEPATTRTPEEDARLTAQLAEHVKMSRRLSLTPGLMAWLWDPEEKLRETARATVAAWREAKEKSAQTGSAASRPADNPEKSRPSRDPFQIAYANFKRSNHPEDLEEFNRRIKLFRQLVLEEAARSRIGT
jgi:hypothetical protein